MSCLTVGGYTTTRPSLQGDPQQCAFPFTFKQVKYSSCIDFSTAKPFMNTSDPNLYQVPGMTSWCSLVSGYSKTDSTKLMWGYCTCGVHPTTAKPTAKPTSLRPTTAVPTLKPTTLRPTTRTPTVKASTLKPTTRTPTVGQTSIPTTGVPTPKPSSQAPTNKPSTLQPTKRPTTVSPTIQPGTTSTPTVQPDPTAAPTKRPTKRPTSQPTALRQTLSPTIFVSPTPQPTPYPTFQTLAPVSKSNNTSFEALLSDPIVAAGVGVGGSFVLFGLFFAIVCVARRFRKKKHVNSSAVVAYSGSTALQPKMTLTALTSTPRRFPLARPRWGGNRESEEEDTDIVVNSHPVEPSPPVRTVASWSSSRMPPPPPPPVPQQGKAAAQTRSELEEKSEDRSGQSQGSADLAKYRRMLRIGLSQDAVKHAMAKDGVPFNQLPELG